MIATWNYCTFTHRALAVFAFNLFDTDHSGSIDYRELDAKLHRRNVRHAP